MREMLSVELPVFCIVTTCAAPVAPLAILAHVSEVGVTTTVGPPAATVTPTVVDCVMLPETPVIVIVDVPSAVPDATLTVSVLAEVVGFGLNDAVMPLDSPDALRLTLPVNPFVGTTVMVLVP